MTKAGKQSGFTLMEAMVATVLMGTVLLALAHITSQWLPSWNRGFARTQQLERLGIGIDRVVADLSAAQYVETNSAQPFFAGTALSAVLVTAASGPNASPGLEFVRLMERADSEGLMLVRESVPFRPGGFDQTIQFRNSVVLVRAPYRVSFAYAGADGRWVQEWKDRSDLPRLVRVSVRDAASGRPAVASTIAALGVNGAGSCVRAKNPAGCLANLSGDKPLDPTTSASEAARNDSN